MLSHISYGISDDIALIIAGVHGSELSGIEVANWVRVKLQQSSVPPLYTTIVVPEVFPKLAQDARNERIRNRFADELEDSNTGRDAYVGKKAIGTNRQFPRPEEPFASLTGKTA